MLLNLHVKNLALIKEVDVDFTNGLVVLTGETGAGKSLILGSVNIALGKKVEKDIIPEVESVEGVASVNESGGIEKKIEVIIQQGKIDKMNEKVQDAIDGKLSDAEKKLDKGEKKLEDGKSELDSQKQEAADKIAKGETKLNSATDKIKDGLKAIDENITKIEEQKKTLADSEKQLKSGMATISANKTKL